MKKYFKRGNGYINQGKDLEYDGTTSGYLKYMIIDALERSQYAGDNDV